MKMAAFGWCVGLGLGLGLVLACGVAPGQIGATGSGESASSSTTAGASTSAAVDDTGPIAEGSGGASSQGASSSDAGTTAGVQPGTSTGDEGTTSSASTGTTAAGSESGQPSSSESSGTQVPSCDDLFGAAPDYLLCAESDEECHFNATTGGGNCDQMCGMFGATCNGAFDNPNTAGQECDIIMPNTDTCATNRGTEICVCAK